jgi:hypothetical protein
VTRQRPMSDSDVLCTAVLSLVGAFMLAAVLLGWFG